MTNELDDFVHDMHAKLRSITSFGQIVFHSLQDRLTEQEKDYLERVLKAGFDAGELLNDYYKAQNNE